MRVSFKDERLRKECNDIGLLQKRYGQTRAKRILQRLEDLASAKTLEDMRHFPGRCHELHGDEAGYLSLELDHPCCLVLCPSADQPRKPNGGMDWAHVKAVDIIGVRHSCPI